jgi:hypothetical protein
VQTDAAGRSFREAWIAGVRKHFPGEPKPSYVAPWEEMPDWERDSAAGVYELVRTLITTSQGRADRLSRTQKGQYVALCWLTHIYKHFPDPKPSYVADWEQLPDWQKETDADIFEHINHETSQTDTGSGIS